MAYRYFRILVLAGMSLAWLGLDAQIYSVREFQQNSKEADFSAVFLGDDIVFCSSRSKKTTSYNADSADVFYTDLFISKYDGNGHYHPAEPLKGNVNTFFNEGHATFSFDGLTMYYTANLMKKSGKSHQRVDEYKLGIFIAENNNGIWNWVGEFEHNSQNGKFSTAHPFLSNDGKTLYFASNRPGGFGGSDIYKCVKTAEGWSEPVNLGREINGKGNEFFPFVNKNGTLFFTTDGRLDSEGMDIYCSYLGVNHKYDEPFRLNNTINSPFDELAYFEKRDSNMGVFSSNRNGNLDDIFIFEKTEDQNRICEESEEPISCYRFEDENLNVLDKSSPIVYRWEMGDGTQLFGDVIEYCYVNPGVYTVVLNAIDTVTRMVFTDISEAQVVVRDPKSPYILLPDTVFTGVEFEASVFVKLFDRFEIKDIKWYINLEEELSGETIHSTMTTTGSYQARCEILGEKDERGITSRVCIYRNFYCAEPPVEHVVQVPMVGMPKEIPVKVVMNTKSFATYSSDELSISDNFYMLIIAESFEPLSFDDSTFLFIPGEIYEIRTPDGYLYAIERKDNWTDLISLHTQLRDRGLKTSYAQVFNDSSIDKSLVRRGHYGQADELPEAIAQEMDSAILETKTGEDHPVVKEQVIMDNHSSLGEKENQAVISKLETQVDNTVIGSYGEDEVYVNETKEEQTNSSSYENDIAQNKSLVIVENEPLLPVIPSKQDKQPEPQKKLIRLYQIVVDTTVERISLEHSFFKNISTEIAEVKTSTGYKYSILTAPEERYLISALAELKSKGYQNAHISEYDLNTFSKNLIRIGKYSKKSNIESFNKEFEKLHDIKFEYNSCEISLESHKTLDYIVSVMTLESDFVLKINAHTCNIGSSEFNKRLSNKRAQSVMDYFTAHGIAKSRLIATGYGDSKPVASNFSVDGRSTNRRVEFVIVFNENE